MNTRTSPESSAKRILGKYPDLRHAIEAVNDIKQAFIDCGVETPVYWEAVGQIVANNGRPDPYAEIITMFAKDMRRYHENIDPIRTRLDDAMKFKPELTVEWLKERYKITSVTDAQRPG